MKVVSWNVENVLRCMPELPAIAAALGTPEVLCLQELRIRRSDREAIGALEGALPGYRCHHALPRDARNVTFRGGRMYGVATFVRGRWQSEVPVWDLEGRVVVVRKSSLAVVNVYAVNGTAKPYYDDAGSRRRRSPCAEAPLPGERARPRPRASRGGRSDHGR